MSDIFTGIDRAWADLARSAGAVPTLAAWVAAEPELADLGDLDEVVTAARDDDDLDGRDRIQLALLRLASGDRAALLAMLHVVRPGLSQVARRYAPLWGDDETDAMVIDIALAKIAAYPTGSAARPAAKIVHGVRNHLWRQRLRDIAAQEAMGSPMEADEETAAPERQASSAELLVRLVTEAVRTGYVSARGARLILLTRVCDVSTVQVAADEGRDVIAVRKYRQRAEAALAHVAETVAC